MIQKVKIYSMAKDTKRKKWSNEIKEQRYINEDATEAFCM